MMKLSCSVVSGSSTWRKHAVTVLTISLTVILSCATSAHPTAHQVVMGQYLCLLITINLYNLHGLKPLNICSELEPRHYSRLLGKKEVTANLSFDYPLISGCDNMEKGVIKKAIPDVVTKAREKGRKWW